MTLAIIAIVRQLMYVFVCLLKYLAVLASFITYHNSLSIKTEGTRIGLGLSAALRVKWIIFPKRSSISNNAYTLNCYATNYLSLGSRF